jgi:hypothetical protein
MDKPFECIDCPPHLPSWQRFLEKDFQNPPAKRRCSALI